MPLPARIAAFLLAAASPSPLLAQAPPVPPADYALTNARIVVAPGSVIERGTVVVRDGRIAAVGANVAAPADAVRLDLAGMTIYPGLIDAATTAGMPRPAPAQRFGGGGGGSSSRPDDGPPDELNPAREAAAVFSASDSVLRPHRNAGFTTLGLAFQGGIFPGQMAVVSTGGPGDQSRVLRSPFAMQVNLGRARGQYPATTMGAIAYVTQSMLDARRDRNVREAFMRDPASAPRPANDPEHRALEAAAAGAQPVVIAAERENELRRAIRLMRDLGLNYTIVGATEGWLAQDVLFAEKRPVLVSLDFPTADAITSRVFELHVKPLGEKDPADARADSAALVSARANATILNSAGVPIALVSYGVSSPAEFRSRIRAAIEAGLSPDDALRALTITPARWMGLERAVGTVEAGKLANLIVTNGALFDSATVVRHVFVEGVKYDVPLDTARSRRRGDGNERRLSPSPQRPQGTTTIEEISASGSWDGSIQGSTEESMSITLRLTQDGGAVTGEVGTADGPGDVTGSLNASNLLLTGEIALPGGATPVVIGGTIDGDRLEGIISIGGKPGVPFTATRSGPGGN